MRSQHFKTVVFVCTGNFYRSRFSEHLFNARAQKAGLNWRASSRGLQTWTADGEGPISEFAAYRLIAKGLLFDWKRFPIQLSQADLENADLVVALKKAEHHSMMLKQFPDWAEKIQYWHIDDLDCATADEALPICEECVDFLVKSLLAAQEEQEIAARSRRAA